MACRNTQSNETNRNVRTDSGRNTQKSARTDGGRSTRSNARTDSGMNSQSNARTNSGRNPHSDIRRDSCRNTQNNARTDSVRNTQRSGRRYSGRNTQSNARMDSGESGKQKSTDTQHIDIQSVTDTQCGDVQSVTDTQRDDVHSVTDTQRDDVHSVTDTQRDDIHSVTDSDTQCSDSQSVTDTQHSDVHSSQTQRPLHSDLVTKDNCENSAPGCADSSVCFDETNLWLSEIAESDHSYAQTLARDLQRALFNLKRKTRSNPVPFQSLTKRMDKRRSKSIHRHGGADKKRKTIGNLKQSVILIKNRNAEKVGRLSEKKSQALVDRSVILNLKRRYRIVSDKNIQVDPAVLLNSEKQLSVVNKNTQVTQKDFHHRWACDRKRKRRKRNSDLRKVESLNTDVKNDHLYRCPGKDVKSDHLYCVPSKDVESDHLYRAPNNLQGGQRTITREPQEEKDRQTTNTTQHEGESLVTNKSREEEDQNVASTPPEKETQSLVDHHEERTGHHRGLSNSACDVVRSQVIMECEESGHQDSPFSVQDRRKNRAIHMAPEPSETNTSMQSATDCEGKSLDKPVQRRRIIRKPLRYRNTSTDLSNEKADLAETVSETNIGVKISTGFEGRSPDMESHSYKPVERKRIIRKPLRYRNTSTDLSDEEAELGETVKSASSARSSKQQTHTQTQQKVDSEGEPQNVKNHKVAKLDIPQPTHVDENHTGDRLKTDTGNHARDRSFRCEICQAAFRHSTSLKKHKLCHTGEKPFMCHYCAAVFRVSAALQAHIRTHTGEKPYQCDKCPAAFTAKAVLMVHRRTHTDERPFKCPTCSKAFKDKRAFTPHVKRHALPDSQQFPCEACEAAFASKSDLKTHILASHDLADFRCKICAVLFTSPKKLQRHAKVHTAERVHQCDRCPASFTRPYDLTAHRRTHTGERPYRCPQCPATFATSSSMTQHRRRHTGEKPYACDLCEARFTQLYTLTCHRRIHGAEGPIKCDLCTAAFKRRSDWKCHMTKLHGSEN